MEDNIEKPDFDKMARKYALTLVDKESLDGSPNFICYRAGLEKGYSLAQSRILELEENYEGMKQHCRALTQINVANMAFVQADSNWIKQHQVKEGENFIDWYMRFHAAEISELKEEIERLKNKNK